MLGFAALAALPLAAAPVSAVALFVTTQDAIVTLFDVGACLDLTFPCAVVEIAPHEAIADVADQCTMVEV